MARFRGLGLEDLNSLAMSMVWFETKASPEISLGSIGASLPLVGPEKEEAVAHT